MVCSCVFSWSSQVAELETSLQFALGEQASDYMSEATPSVISASGGSYRGHFRHVRVHLGILHASPLVYVLRAAVCVCARARPWFNV